MKEKWYNIINVTDFIGKLGTEKSDLEILELIQELTKAKIDFILEQDFFELRKAENLAKSFCSFHKVDYNYNKIKCQYYQSVPVGILRQIQDDFNVKVECVSDLEVLKESNMDFHHKKRLYKICSLTKDDKFFLIDCIVEIHKEE